MRDPPTANAANELTPLISGSNGAHPNSSAPLVSPSYAASSPSSSAFSSFAVIGELEHNQLQAGNLSPLFAPQEDDAVDDHDSSQGNEDDVGDVGESPYAHVASPAKVLGSACVKGDFFQAQSAVEMAVSRAIQATERQEQLQEESRAERVLAEVRKRRVATSVFRLLTVHEARHQMNALHLAVLYEHPTVVAHLVSVAKQYNHAFQYWNAYKEQTIRFMPRI